jgi:hypothetical protein
MHDISLRPGLAFTSGENKIGKRKTGFMPLFRLEKTIKLHAYIKRLLI